jgi:hypothetical protein
MDRRGVEDERLATWEGTGEGPGGGSIYGENPTEPSLFLVWHVLGGGRRGEA